MIFVIVGLWQFLHYITGLPFLNIQTRDYIHSVGSRAFFINNRLTSLASEPSYFASLVIDMMILAFLVSKKPLKPFFLGLFILIFSYSGGGFLNILILIPFFLIGYIKYKGYRFKKINIFKSAIIITLISVVFIYKRDEIYNLMYPILGRIDTIFDINKHSRMFIMIMPFLWVLEGNVINALFGYGPNSYSYLSLTKFLPNGNRVHTTSNSFYSDTIFELGYVGFSVYIWMFIRLIFTSFKNIYNNKNFFISMLLSVHLAASSIYRADFMQPRFWILLFIIVKLINNGMDKQ